MIRQSFYLPVGFWPDGSTLSCGERLCRSPGKHDIKPGGCSHLQQAHILLMLCCMLNARIVSFNCQGFCYLAALIESLVPFVAPQEE